ncbi:hypothetical protein VTK73DRAFT_8101 [Phialemonium thermophilum]|uniref:Uncharacterized protein n=1 Tax=Phialemonium thermophilum TaxID=223376 RepID=A0ABR3WB04_9PEZI
MDPTTTLFTFMLQTDPSVQVVHLVGSWDNFSRTYSMERDSRRDRSQWRGCHSFKDIICDGDGGTSPRRNGGLKMGQTYYFYYELDGSTETYDPSLPYTNTCPYLPGQTVNTLWVPVEQSLRKRSASLSSMRDADLKTMDPRDKFSTPRPAPLAPGAWDPQRLGTAPFSTAHRRSARSLSPGMGWSWSPRKLFSRRSSSSLREYERPGSRTSPLPTPPSSEGVRSALQEAERPASRDLTPDGLRRFLSDDYFSVTEEHHLHEDNDRPSLVIPEEIAEENEDDDNFATSTTTENLPFTVLSPPPTQYSYSSTPSVTFLRLPSRESLGAPTTLKAPAPEPPTRSPPPAPATSSPSPPMSQQHRISFAGNSYFTLASPLSPPLNDPPSFYHSENEDDDEEESHSTIDRGRVAPFPNSISTYSLPESSGDGAGVFRDCPSKAAAKDAAQIPRFVGSPGMEAARYRVISAAAATTVFDGFLTNPIPDSGLDDLVSELGWMAGMIGRKSV